jgi:hypothetical protein
MALRVLVSMQANRGALTKTRSEAAPQSGQMAGSLRAATVRNASKPPQDAQW